MNSTEENGASKQSSSLAKSFSALNGFTSQYVITTTLTSISNSASKDTEKGNFNTDLKITLTKSLHFLSANVIDWLIEAITQKIIN